jgi:peptide/nickel transport system permease protein
MSPRYLGRRLVQAVLTILFVVLLNFILFRAMPGSPERVLLRNPHLTQATIQAARARWGLDKPTYPINISLDPLSVTVAPENQLFDYVASSSTGDLGYSLLYRGRSVVDVIEERFWPTILLIGLAELVAIVVGLALGAYAGWRRGGLTDRLGNGLSLILYSMPYFVIGMPMIIIFAAGLHWFPTSGMLSPSLAGASDLDKAIDIAKHTVLPLTTIALGLIGGYSILMRSSIIETRSEDYVTTARAKGLSDRRIMTAHAFPNALLPTVTIVAINLGYVVAGAITAEIVFNWPGLGTLTVDALKARDYPLLQGVFLLLSATVIFANLIADLLYGILDPRVRT